MKGRIFVELLAVCKRFSVRPSVVVGVEDAYAAWCLDEACMYALCRIEQEGALPPSLLPGGSLQETVAALGAVKGVKVIDKRRNGGGLSYPLDR